MILNLGLVLLTVLWFDQLDSIIIQKSESKRNNFQNQRNIVLIAATFHTFSIEL